MTLKLKNYSEIFTQDGDNDSKAYHKKIHIYKFCKIEQIKKTYSRASQSVNAIRGGIINIHITLTP